MDPTPPSSHPPLNLNEPPAPESENETSVEIKTETTQETEKEAPRSSPKSKYEFDLNEPCSSSDHLLSLQMELKTQKQSCVEGNTEEESSHNEPWYWDVDETTEDLIWTVMFTQSYTEVTLPDDPANPGVIEDIKRKILCGQIDRATGFLKWHYPKLIEEPRQITCVLYALAYQTALEMVRERKLDLPPKFAEIAWDLYNDYPWLQQDILKFDSLLNSEDPSQHHLLDLSRRQQTANFVLNQIASLGCDDKNEKQKSDEIMKAIRRGDISLAMAHVNRQYYFQIRDPNYNPRMIFELAYQHAIELVRCGKVEQARGFAETTLNQIATTNSFACSLDELSSLQILINSEVPSESPKKGLLILARRNYVSYEVEDEISNMRNSQMPNVPGEGNHEDHKEDSICSGN